MAWSMQASHWSRSGCRWKRHVPRAQTRVAKALGVMLRPAQPAAQEPEQLLAGIGQVVAVHRAQAA
jgi:hypothetical protein